MVPRDHAAGGFESGTSDQDDRATAYAGVGGFESPSHIDAIIYAAIEPSVMVAKAEIRGWPVIGMMARACGTLFVDRDSRSSALAVTEQVAERLKGPLPVLFFPEGTSTDGSEVLRFHSRLFTPAVEAGVPITTATIRYVIEDGTPERELCWFGDTLLCHISGRRWAFAVFMPMCALASRGFITIGERRRMRLTTRLSQNGTVRLCAKKRHCSCVIIKIRIWTLPPAGGGAVDPRTTRLVDTRNSRCKLGFPGLFAMLAEGFEAALRQVNAGEPDGGERRKRELGEIDVVEADDGQILGHAQALHVGGAQNADGGHVIRADDCCGPCCRALQFPEAGYAALEGVVALDDPFLLDGQFASCIAA